MCDLDGGICIGGPGGGPGGGSGGGFPSLDGGLFPMGCDGVTSLCAATECCVVALGVCQAVGSGLPPLATFCGVNGGVCATCTFPKSCNMTSGTCN